MSKAPYGVDAWLAGEYLRVPKTKKDKPKKKKAESAYSIFLKGIGPKSIKRKR